VLWQRDSVRLNRTDDPEEPWSSQVSALFQQFNDYECDMLFIDTLANTFGGNENSQQDANNYLAAIRMFVNAGAPVVIVHHNTKEGDDSRGSTVFEGAVDTKVAVKESKGKVHLYITQQKDGDPGFNLNMRLKVYDWTDNDRDFSSVVLEENLAPQLTSKQHEILGILEAHGGLGLAELAEARGTSKQAANDMLQRMLEVGLVIQDDDLVWHSTLEEL
jgi:hypothetical protein